MTNGNVNPWEPMNFGSIRRINSELPHDVFWIRDQEGHYGFYLQSTEKFPEAKSDIDLKGVSLIKRNTVDIGELYLILKRHSDWELFLSVCDDILSVCVLHQTNKKMIEAVEVRLRRWQIFLTQNNDLVMSAELQMGLISELLLLKKLIPSYGAKESILAWTGPDKDKQDFNFPKTMIEVKSYRTSKGAKVTISSTHQLLSESKPLYLVSFGLTLSENGVSIKNLLSEFYTLLYEESTATQQLFENKITNYGYMPGMNDEALLNFTVDSMRTFEVSANFPRLLPHQVPAEIVKLNYSIDLELCKTFERSYETIL
ncbi:hypothetical protein GCM10017764_35770 [Sphingobacterium griseoflavum]|uniref:PD-(D/E)XK motif protein n=2 Tax=Sphingobacterium griseoflavum TaxID=1474952 RepID=A0ABQ3I2V7_9SPHI|nr:hypothetical protein GCM10017764_35770 [Sphingobacterium griseoflavum]